MPIHYGLTRIRGIPNALNKSASLWVIRRERGQRFVCRYKLFAALCMSPGKRSIDVSGDDSLLNLSFAIGRPGLRIRPDVRLCGLFLLRLRALLLRDLKAG